MILDCHTHIGRNSNVTASVNELLKSMDKAGIDKSIVIAGRNLNDCPNDYLLEQIKPHKDRLSAVAACDIKNYHLIKKDIDSGNFVGIKFYLGYEHYYPTDWKVCDILSHLDNKIPAIFHCGDCLCTAKGAKIKYARPLGLDDVAVDFPNQKIVIAHMGWPWHKDTAYLMYRHKNVYTDISGFVYKDFDSESASQFNQVLIDMRELVPYDSIKDKLLFGTDWPISNQDSYIQIVNEVKNFSENGQKVFNLS